LNSKTATVVTVLSLMKVAAETPVTPPVTAEQVAAAQNALALRKLQDELAQQALKQQTEMAKLQAALDATATTAGEAAKQALEFKKDLATMEATIATQQKAEREAVFGATLAPRDGTITATSTAEAMIVAQSRLEAIAQATAGEISSLCDRPSRVYVVSGFLPGDLKGARSTRLLVIRDLEAITSSGPSGLDGLIKKMQAARAATPEEQRAILDSNKQDAFYPDAPTEKKASNVASAGIVDVTGVFQSALSLLALTRVNRTFSGVTLTADNNAFLSTIVAELHDAGIPDVQLGLETGDGSQGLMKKLFTLDQLVSSAGFELAETAKVTKERDAETAKDKEGMEARKLALAEIIRLLDELANNDSPPPGRKEELEKQRAAAEVDIDKFKKRLKARGEYLKNLAAIKEDMDKLVKRGSDYLSALEKGKIMGVDVGRMLDVEDYERSLQTGRMILFVNVNNVAGTNFTKQSLLSNSFQTGAGVSVSYSAIGPGFSTIAADTIYGYKGFYRVKDRNAGEIPSHPAIKRVEASTEQKTRPSKRWTTSGPASK
jgi:DNA-binding transcriptional MerR regulator